MEELKQLIEAIANLPSLAIWVLAGFLMYKLAVVGSVYGLVRFAIDKWHSWKTTPKHTLEVRELQTAINGMVISEGDVYDALVGQIHRVRGKGVRINSNYIHQGGVDWLRQAIDDKIAKDISNEK